MTAKERFKLIPEVFLILIKDGKVKAMQVGAVPKETLKKWIDKNL